MPSNETFYDRVAKLCGENDISISAALKAMQMSPASATAWKNGDYEPSTGVVQRIADYFLVSVDYLLGRPELRVAISHPDGYDQLTADQKDFIQASIDKFIEQNHEKLDPKYRDKPE